MATAKQPGGLYYVAGDAVDANGVEVKGAPKMEPNTVTDPNTAYESADARSAKLIGEAIAKAINPGTTHKK